MAVLTLGRIWECPQCPTMTRTVDASVPLHACPSVGGLMVPLVPQGQKARHVVIERGDYVGRNLVNTDAHGRPVSAVYTERPDGSHDTCAYPDTATADAEQIEEARDGLVE